VLGDGVRLDLLRADVLDDDDNLMMNTLTMPALKPSPCQHHFPYFKDMYFVPAILRKFHHRKSLETVAGSPASAQPPGGVCGRTVTLFKTVEIFLVPEIGEGQAVQKTCLPAAETTELNAGLHSRAQFTIVPGNPAMKALVAWRVGEL